MCLQTNKGAKLCTAKEDIVVYKYVEKLFGRYYTPYRGTLVCIGKSYKSKLQINTLKNIVDLGLHSFKNEKVAVDMCKQYKNHYSVKCIIPKGSKYYIGTFDIGLYHTKKVASYASDNIMYVELI